MSFFLGLFFGVALGVLLIVGYARFENVRSKRRSDLAHSALLWQKATTIAAFARMTVEDSRKLLPPQYYPSWVLTWLNHQLDKIWPYVDEAASELIRTSVEPILEQYRPVVVASLKFSKLTLGTVAPQFTGVSVIDGDDGAITMELDFQWDGNPNITLDIKTRVGVGLPIQLYIVNGKAVLALALGTPYALKVERYALSSTPLGENPYLLWLIFKPLVDEFPCFGAVCFSLRENRNLDFTLKVVGGDISAIPGISDAIEETIRNAIEDSITWPVRQIIPIIPGDYSDLELKPCGTLEVKLIQAKELTNKDIIGKSDPYAVNNQLNPIWNEHFEFTVEDAETQHLTVRVFDDEGVQASEIIGCAQIPLKELEPGKVKDVWLKLVKDLQVQRDNKNRGQVHLELLYCPIGMESVFTNPFNRDFRLTALEKSLKSGIDGPETDPAKSAQQKRRDIIVRGVLSVTVISAEDLPAVDLMGKSDPYVIVIMKKSEQKQKTRVVNKTLNPVWNQTFDFVVEDGLHDLLMLEVWDHDTFGKDKMGKCIMTLTRVILEEEFTDTFPVEGTKEGKLNLHIKWAPQPIFRDS
ncbi:hypothetical protein LguiA_032989 [Lonicera macranthoides]